MKSLVPLLIAACLLVSGCSPVRSLRPVGLQPVNLKDVEEEWAGAWSTSDGDTVLMSVADAEKGRLRLTYLEGKGTEVRSVEAELRETGTTRFFNARDQDHPQPERWVWARLDQDGRQIVTWLPRNERVKESIEKGYLPGTAPKQEDVTLGELSEAQQRRLAEEESNLYQWDKPLVFFKTSK